MNIDQFYELFKKYVIQYQCEFGLTSYKINFEKKKGDSGTYATIAACHESGTATITIHTNAWKDSPEDEQIRRIALHEITHLLTERLESLAMYRFVSEREIDEAREEIARRMENREFKPTYENKKSKNPKAKDKKETGKVS